MSQQNGLDPNNQAVEQTGKEATQTRVPAGIARVAGTLLASQVSRVQRPRPKRSQSGRISSSSSVKGSVPMRSRSRETPS